MGKLKNGPWFTKEQKAELQRDADNGVLADELYKKAKGWRPDLTPEKWWSVRSDLGAGPLQRALGGKRTVYPDRRRVWDYTSVYQLMMLCLEAGPRVSQSDLIALVLPEMRKATKRSDLTEAQVVDMLRSIHMGEVQRKRELRGEKASTTPVPKLARKAVAHARRDFALAASRKASKVGVAQITFPKAAKPVQGELALGGVPVPSVPVVARQPVAILPKEAKVNAGRQSLKALAVEAVLTQVRNGMLKDQSPGGIERAVREFMAALEAVD